MSNRADPTVLLEQTGWLRALARSLAVDAQLADDLVQDALVAALERPPELDRPVRGWLASVLRNRWLDLARERGRRQERERTSASDEAWPSSHAVVERAAIQRELVAAVLELDEPYRTTVLLRFFEELPQREIARRMRTTTATVNSRLTRALAKLRERMSRGDGPLAWLRVLVPLLREPATVPAAALGASAMKVSLVSVAIAASVVAGIVLWKSSSTEPGRPEARAARAESAEAARRPGASVALVESPSAPSEARIPVVATAEPSAQPLEAPVTPAPRTVRGRVMDPTGHGLAGIALVLSASDSKATSTSGPGGWFEIGVDVPAESILCADPRYATVLAGSARVLGATQPTVVVAPRIDLAGSVVDEGRAPIANAEIRLHMPAGFGADFGFALDYTVPQEWTTESAAGGRFELQGVPAVDGATIVVTHAGFVPRAEPSPLVSMTAIEIVLARPGAASGIVRGVVIDPSGEHVEGARVSAGTEIALTDARGEFTLDVSARVDLSAGTQERLVALKPGLLPGIFEPERDADGRPWWPAEVVIRLGGPTGNVAGRVIDADGAPIGGAKVWIDDPTPFGNTYDARLAVESVLRGDERFWSYEQTKPDGTFMIEGLFQRAYRLQALDPRTLASSESEPVAPGAAPIELRMPTRDVHERVAGRVVSGAGQAIPGVTVRAYRVTYEVHHESGTDNDVEEAASVITGADGTFELRDVAKNGVDLIATGDTIFGASAKLEGEPDPTRIELVAELRLHLQVELDPPVDRADQVRVLDASGQRVWLSVFRGGGSHTSFRMPIHDGRSAVLSVAERAAVLVLYREDQEVGRVPLQLTPGATNVVRY